MINKAEATLSPHGVYLVLIEGNAKKTSTSPVAVMGKRLERKEPEVYRKVCLMK